MNQKVSDVRVKDVNLLINLYGFIHLYSSRDHASEIRDILE